LRDCRNGNATRNDGQGVHSGTPVCSRELRVVTRLLLRLEGRIIFPSEIEVLRLKLALLRDAYFAGPVEY
jgi:hypothetical protein